MKKIIAILLILLMVPAAVLGYEGEKMTYFNGTLTDGAQFDTVHPSYFDIQEDGSLKINAIDQALVRQYQSKGTKVEPYLSNHWNREAGILALENRQELAVSVAQAVKDYGLDGVNVDIENVTHEQRADYVDFVRLLKIELPDHRVSVAVAANPSNWQTGWHGSYDNKALAQVADYLVLMGYDQSYQNGPEGPVAGGDWVEKSLQQLLKDAPASKVVLAIPFFGRGWSEDGSRKGFSVSQKDVDRLAQNYPSSKGYDVETRSAYLKFTVPEEGPFPSVIGAKELPAGNYTIWYDDQRAGRYKISLAEKYQLMGMDSWAFGQQSPDYPDIFSSDFSYFEDMEGHWGKGEGEAAYESNLMVGRTETLFVPDETMTRAEAATVLVRLAGLEQETSQTTFADTDGHWAQNAIGVAKDNGLIQGVGSNRFEPDVQITRQDFAVMVANVLDLPTANGAGFQDVAEDSYAYSSIILLSGHGILMGFEDGTFRPLEPVSRIQAAAVAVRAAAV